MTAQEATKYLNREGVYTTGSLNVRIKVVDAKEHFGRIDFRVTPCQGSGEQWVSQANVALDPEKGPKKG
jgi:hypothetical protein